MNYNPDNKKAGISKLADGIKISIKVIPNSSRCEISATAEDGLKLRLDVPPVEGKANAKCIKFLSRLLDVPKTSITITSGEKSRNKVFYVRGNPDRLLEILYTHLQLFIGN